MIQRRGFTLIELLIVVAIIAILAAIAVPNFLEAQTRARVSRTDNDLRTIELAMESYRIDNNGYPTSYNRSPIPPKGTLTATDRRLLTTPIAYLNEIPQDVFRIIAGAAITAYAIYSTTPDDSATKHSYNLHPRMSYIAYCYGPDKVQDTGGYYTLAEIIINERQPVPSTSGGRRYDPTNGTISEGDIYRFGGHAKGGLVRDTLKGL